MIAALWSNPNFDDDKGSRQQAIKDIEEKFDSALQIVFTGRDPEEEEIDYNNPFFAPVKRGMTAIEVPRDDEGLDDRKLLYDPHDNDQG